MGYRYILLPILLVLVPGLELGFQTGGDEGTNEMVDDEDGSDQRCMNRILTLGKIEASKPSGRGRSVEQGVESGEVIGNVLNSIRSPTGLLELT